MSCCIYKLIFKNDVLEIVFLRDFVVFITFYLEVSFQGQLPNIPIDKS